MKIMKNKKNILTVLGIVTLTLISIFLIKITFTGVLVTLSSAIKIIIVPALIALFISYLIAPISIFFEKKCKMKKNYAVILTIFISILFLFGLLSLIFIFLGNIVADLFENFWPQIENFLNQYIPADMLNNFENILKELTVLLEKMDKEKVIELLTSIFGIISIGFTAIIDLLMMLILIPVFLFFLLKEKNRIFSGISYILPKRYAKELTIIGSRSNEVIEKFFKGKIITMFIISILFTILFYILGLGHFAILFGFLIGFLDIIPYIGPLIGVIVPIIYSLSIADKLYLGYLTPVLILVMNFVIQFFQENILQPKIIGKEVDIHPLLIFVAMLFFGKVFGIAGIIVAVPICGIIKVVNEYFRSKYKKPEEDKNIELTVNSVE